MRVFRSRALHRWRTWVKAASEGLMTIPLRPLDGQVLSNRVGSSVVRAGGQGLLASGCLCLSASVLTRK